MGGPGEAIHPDQEVKASYERNIGDALNMFQTFKLKADQLDKLTLALLKDS